VASWNGGSTSINDTTTVSTTLAGLARMAGENAGSYAVTGAAFGALSGAGAANYNAPTFAGSPTLAITTAPLAATIASQTKVYGQDDPALLGITPALSGVVNGVSVTNWMGASTALNDSVNAALASLARQAGENVGSYAITGASFGALSGTGASNYSAPTFGGSQTLTITPAPVTVIAVTKTYDASTGVTGAAIALSGALNRSVGTWIGTASVNDSLSLAYAGGSYDNRNTGTGKIVTLKGASLSGSGAGNYTVADLSGGSYVGSAGVINRAPLTVVAQANTKAFDGTTSAAATPTVAGLQGTDTAVASEIYDTPTAGTGKTLTPAATVNDGNGGANYIVSLVSNANGVITSTSPNPTPTPTPTPSPALDPTVPVFIPTVTKKPTTTEEDRVASATPPAIGPTPRARLLTVSNELTEIGRAVVGDLTVSPTRGRLRTLVSGASFVIAYSDGSSEDEHGGCQSAINTFHGTR
jgi:hypothetical protein